MSLVPATIGDCSGLVGFFLCLFRRESLRKENLGDLRGACGFVLCPAHGASPLLDPAFGRVDQSESPRDTFLEKAEPCVGFRGACAAPDALNVHQMILQHFPLSCEMNFGVLSRDEGRRFDQGERPATGYAATDSW